MNQTHALSFLKFSHYLRGVCRVSWMYCSQNCCRNAKNRRIHWSLWNKQQGRKLQRWKPLGILRRTKVLLWKQFCKPRNQMKYKAFMVGLVILVQLMVRYIPSANKIKCPMMCVAWLLCLWQHILGSICGFNGYKLLCINLLYIVISVTLNFLFIHVTVKCKVFLFSFDKSPCFILQKLWMTFVYLFKWEGRTWRMPRIESDR